MYQVANLMLAFTFVLCNVFFSYKNLLCPFLCAINHMVINSEAFFEKMVVAIA